MLQKLHSSGLTADKETIRLTLKSLDPVGADKRKRRKLTHCEYHSFGANHTWHIDGYDQLKPFGRAIHGAIDVGIVEEFFGLNYRQAITLKLLQTITYAVSRSRTSFHMLSEAITGLKI